MSSVTIFPNGSQQFVGAPVTLQTARGEVTLASQNSDGLTEEELLVATIDAAQARVSEIRIGRPTLHNVLALQSPVAQSDTHVELILYLLQSLLSASMTTPGAAQVAASLEPSSVPLLQLTETSPAELGKTFAACACCLPTHRRPPLSSSFRTRWRSKSLRSSTMCFAQRSCERRR